MSKSPRKAAEPAELAAKLTTEAKELGEEYARLSHQTVSTAWKMGGKLKELRDLLSADEWLRLINNELPLGARGITAARFLSLHRVFPNGVSRDLESVTQALMSASRRGRI